MTTDKMPVRLMEWKGEDGEQASDRSVHMP